MIRAQWTGVAAAELAGVLFLPAGIAVAAEPDIASCEQAQRNCVEHGNNNRSFKTTRSGATEEKGDDADPFGGAVSIPAKLDCSSGTATEAFARIDDSDVVSGLVTLLASDADDATDDDGSGSKDEDDPDDDESESDDEFEDDAESEDDSESEEEDCDDDSDDGSEPEDDSDPEDDSEPAEDDSEPQDDSNSGSENFGSENSGSEDDTGSEDEPASQEPEPKDVPTPEVKSAPAAEPETEEAEPEPQTGTVPEPAPSATGPERPSVRPGDQLEAVERAREAAQNGQRATVPAPGQQVGTVPVPAATLQMRRLGQEAADLAVLVTPGNPTTRRTSDGSSAAAVEPR
jgi:hypothetical protein